MRRNIETWTGHVIVCGLNRVGVRTVEQLHLAGVRAVVVDDQPEHRYTQTVRAWGVPQILRGRLTAKALNDAGLAGASAVICAQSNDLHTLETALLARELRPDIRVVVQMRNPAVGRALINAGVAVLDVAGLSAPSIIGICTRSGVHHVDLEGSRFVIADTVVGNSTTLRLLYGDLIPVAISPVGGGIVVCPGRDHTVKSGDRVTLLGTPTEIQNAGLCRPSVPESAPTAHRGGARTWWREITASLGDAIERPLRLVIGGVAGLLVFSTVFLHVGYAEPDGTRMSLLDALYFTVETLATVGYGDFSFRHQPSTLRLFAIVLMVLGAALVPVLFALLANLLVSRRIEESLGRQRITGLSGHVIVIGLGSIGLRVVRQLRAAGKSVVVVDSNESNRYLAQVRTAGIPVLIADATLPDTLQTANLDGASAVAILTSDDLVNLEIGLAIRDQCDRSAEMPVALRLFDRRLAVTVERTFDVGHVRSAEALAAPWFVGAALGLDVLATFYVDTTPMLVAALTVAPGGGLDGLTMSKLSARIRVIAIKRATGDGRLEYPLRRDAWFSAGDHAYLLGPYEELIRVLRRDAGSAV